MVWPLIACVSWLALHLTALVADRDWPHDASVWRAS
jgi:hypothetical protein